MPDNPSINDPLTGTTTTPGTSGTTGTTGTTGSTGTTGAGLTGTTGAGTTGTGTGTATALSQTAQEYGQKISDAAIQAKDYARQKPGQALLISAGVGLLLGLIIRGRR